MLDDPIKTSEPDAFLMARALGRTLVIAMPERECARFADKAELVAELSEWFRIGCVTGLGARDRA